MPYRRRQRSQAVRGRRAADEELPDMPKGSWLLHALGWLVLVKIIFFLLAQIA